MKAYFLLGTLLLILVGALLKNSMLMDDENPCWAAVELGSLSMDGGFRIQSCLFKCNT